MSLVYPEIAFECSHNDKNSLKFNHSHDIPARILRIYGQEFATNILAINSQFSGIKVSGYISDPKISFPNKNRQILSVNRRIIGSPIIYRAILNAYNRFIPHGTFPWYILNLEIDPHQVDVNVHPRKLDVRFANENTIFRSFFHGVEDTLNNVSLTNSVASPTLIASQKQYYTGSGTKFKSYSPYKDTSPNPAQAAINFTQAISGWNSSREVAWVEQNRIEDNMISNDLHDTPLWKNYRTAS